ncbi:MAG: biopolymer transporter ExbD [Candidatus Eisenbacteria bacterium]|uniref:Biopolymer transporter ExbD n=1 Tax=Eiseniibacteriota bacterium TaxID=2212470 RepID=A0A948RYA6_UNCEI|nr:biopolymer transporter ExbD [Candidatus Eisenbacteria bacterium]MBU1948746.1 biopolymer transporter ExbD [Candidatus Eisenbacteria bacterium]MBU2690469.1 biopolymer transporter ExbD [Candidatus Eisenbacteria bacterium]
MKFQTENRFLTGMESTAMADIIFLLLIFFLLSSSFILQTGIKITLPEVTQPEMEERQQIVVTVTRDDQLFVNERKITWSNLRTEMEQALSESSSRTVIVKGDAEVSLGRTVEIMDVARELGAERLAIAASPKTKS